MRKTREVIAVNEETGERKVFAGTYQTAKELGTSSQNVMYALARNGVCCGWRLYDNAEALREKIGRLQQLLKEVEAMQ